MVCLEMLQQEEEKVTDDHCHDDSMSVNLILELLHLSELELLVLFLTLFTVLAFFARWLIVKILGYCLKGLRAESLLLEEVFVFDQEVQT